MILAPETQDRSQITTRMTTTTPTLTLMEYTTLLGANIIVILAELSLVLLVLYLLNWIASKLLLR
ncbi:MAG: hypothetical protein GDA56_11655 [Hormoscilla sp. GM7CHS1pb]|nr:hypothetical protein [Hormoscilla sp. GM7CHS1pb]